MVPEAHVHCLLRIGGPQSFASEAGLAPWARAALGRVPWVVVRRAARAGGLIPVGVRGGARSEREAAWLSPDAVLECRDPPGLAARRGWRGHARCTQVASLAALCAVESIMERSGLAGRWGPGGSVGFELASGAATASSSSDLDLIVEAPEPWSTQAAAALHAALTPLAVRADVLIETPRGALSLAEYARARPPYLLRTATGPLLGEAPWPQASAA